MNPLKRISRAQHHSSTAQSPFCACCPPPRSHGWGDRSHPAFVVGKTLV